MLSRYIVLMLLKHPTRTQLITYAEALVDGRGPIFSGIARHLTQCPQCSAEVESICSSLRFFNSTPTIEPPQELTLQILKRAREQKKQNEQTSIPVKRHSPVLVVLCVLVWLTLGYFLFVVGYNPSVQNNFIGKQNIHAEMPTQITKTTTEKETEKNVWHEIELLGSALSPLFQNSKGYSSYQMKFVSVIDQELESAQTALRKNPGCPHANEILQKGVRQKAELLKQLYLDRVL